jgi:hypothetical protein
MKGPQEVQILGSSMTYDSLKDMSLGENRLVNFYLDDAEQLDHTSLEGASNSHTHLPLTTVDPYRLTQAGQ